MAWCTRTDTQRKRKILVRYPHKKWKSLQAQSFEPIYVKCEYKHKHCSKRTNININNMFIYVTNERKEKEISGFFLLLLLLFSEFLIGIICHLKNPLLFATSLLTVSCNRSLRFHFTAHHLYFVTAHTKWINKLDKCCLITSQ